MRELLEVWLVHLKAEHKSPATLRTYKTGVLQFIGWCEANDHIPAVSKRLVAAWIAELLEAGAEPNTADARLSAVKRFSVWLWEDGEQDHDPLRGMKPPKLDEKVVRPLSGDDIKQLLKACRGTRFRDYRDEAIIRLLLETGMRAGECVALQVEDVDWVRGQVTVTRGKGAKGRLIGFGPQTSKAIEAYLRKARAGHTLARSSQQMWLGENGRLLGYSGLWQMLNVRAEQAGIGRLNPHRLRHTLASRWLAAGGSEGGLMSVAGWSQRKMLDRYSKATASARATEEAKKLNLGDV